MAIDFKPLNDNQKNQYNPPNIDFQELPLSQDHPEMVNTFLGEMPKKVNMFKDKEDAQRQLQKSMEIYGSTLGSLALKAPQFIANAISKLPNAAQGAVNLLGRTGAGTALTTGANVLSPENKKSLSELSQENALWNLGAESLPVGLKLGAKAMGKALSPLRPQKYAQDVFNYIGGGKSIEENAKILAQKIKDAYKRSKTAGEKLYDDIFNRASMGKSGIHRLEPKTYSKIDQKIIDRYTPKIEDLHSEYLSNPSLKNAHNLQSQLGSEIRRLEGMDLAKNLDTTGRSTLQSYQKSQRSIINDIKEGLGKDLGRDYMKATENWAKNVVPFIENPKISTIAKKKLEKIKGKDLQNISEAFKNPNEDMLKVVNELGPDAWKHILYDKLGKLRTNLTPERLSKEIENMKNQGFSSYIHPNLEDQILKLSNKSRNRELLQRGIGGITGYKLGSVMGVPGEMAGGALGALLSPNALSLVKSLKPGDATANAVANFMSKTYRPLARTGIAKKEDISNYFEN